MGVLSGLDVFLNEEFRLIRGKRVGVLCHQASVTRDFRHIIDVFAEIHQEGLIELVALFGPQHGIWGHTQDNMVEWEGGLDARTGIPVHSLYGRHRKPTPEMLADVDVLVVDLQDVGSRYYTFIWTLALCLEACEEAGVEVVVLDRPNPIGGERVEGCVLEESFRSFVGWHPLPVRHGMTIGEIARYLQARYYPRCPLTIIPLEGWTRSMYYEETQLPWIPPSPNMPLVETAVVYPGTCLLEGTNLSEGRGTTRPFETLGAPWIDGWQLADALNGIGLAGVHFRPIMFQPTFHKYAGRRCGGVFIHVTDRRTFASFLSGLAILREVIRLYPDRFCWRSPPYEYEHEKLPFDILVGNDWIRPWLEAGRSLREIDARCQQQWRAFEPLRAKALLY